MNFKQIQLIVRQVSQLDDNSAGILIDVNGLTPAQIQMLQIAYMGMVNREVTPLEVALMLMGIAALG